MKAALLNRNGAVIGEVFEAPEKGNTIEIAGAFTIDGSPVNVKKFKISRSKANLAKAVYEQPVSKVNSKYGEIYTFSSVDESGEYQY
ncbi:hypothetical protein [Shewanella decolorationis]|uniref:hypothetical protein n=1 Tax=Shewanella decolorationis TaxID=256839 RepID=UPI0010575A88|nr:hypothetical protein [Shewanella decolorationis]